MILQINDQNDVEQLKNLIDPVMPENIVFLNSYYDLINYNFQKVTAIEDVQFYARMFRLRMYQWEGGPSELQAFMDARKHSRRRNTASKSSHMATAHSNEFNRVMQRAYMELAADLTRQKLTPCVVCSLRTQETIHEDGTVDVFFTASVLKVRDRQSHFFLKRAKEESAAFTKAGIDLPEHLVNWMPEDPQAHQGNEKELLTERNMPSHRMLLSSPLQED
mmetsp:Transcript_3868/g.5157  ORF Transcript_3868/g.5157 Transcript_3868/m.5157 type:complete len:220 (+) Transcript_3868:1386-2045(+)